METSDDNPRQGTEQNGEMTATSGSNTHLLFVLQQTQAAIMSDMQLKFDALAEKLSRKIDLTSSSAVGEILRAVSERGMLADWEEAKNADGSTAKKPPSQLPSFKTIVVKEKAVGTLLQWFCLATVLSFTSAHVGARSWVNENVYERLSERMDSISGASGLSCLFFAVRNQDSKDKYQTPIGKFWTFLIRSAMVSILLHAKQQLCVGTAESGSTGGAVFEGKVPDWLSSFGNRKKMTSIVNSFMDKTERKVGTSSSECSGDGEGQARKRRRVEPDDEQADNRRAALQLLRKHITRWITIGRTELRAHLFEMLLFVVEKIESFPTVEAAREEGFQVIFKDPSDQEGRTGAGTTLSGTIWDIPNAKVRSVRDSRQADSNVDESSLLEENSRSLTVLQDTFPSLTVTVKYKRMVVQDARARTLDERENGIGGETILWPAEERVSLHKIATACLMEAFGCKDAGMVFSSGPLSLKAIHVLAIGLRGLLRQSLGLDLSSVEKTALGNLTHKRVQKGDAKASTLLGNDESGKKKRKEDIRAQKLEMAWNEYMAEKEKMEEQERLREQRTLGSEQSEADNLDDENDDWMTSAGGGWPI